jgi:hypothetical protein
MILDERNEFADSVSVAAAAGTALIGDVIDLGAASRDIGAGQHLYFNLLTDGTEIITGGAAGTIEFRLVSDSTANLATSPTVHFSTGTIVTDDAAVNDARLNANSLICSVALPQGAVYERYLGVLAVIGTTTVTAGSVSAFLSADPYPAQRAYPDAMPV